MCYQVSDKVADIDTCIFCLITFSEEAVFQINGHIHYYRFECMKIFEYKRSILRERFTMFLVPLFGTYSIRKSDN